jgi:endonuclease-3
MAIDRALPKKSAKLKARAHDLMALLYQYYPNPHCELDYETPFQLLIATILSAQCTDVRVNIVTKTLFREYPDAASMAQAPVEELEEIVKSTGFYRNKALSLSETSKAIVERFGGEVPQTMDELLTLRGAARKTANVVLGNAFGINAGVVVDTHVNRLANRFGLTTSDNPLVIERDLMALFPQQEWTNLSHLLILHGRAACKARFAKPSGHEVCMKFGVNCSCKKDFTQSR